MIGAVEASALDLGIAAAVAVVLLALSYRLGRKRNEGPLRQRMIALTARLGGETPARDPRRLEEALGQVERATDRAAEAVAESSADAIRLRRALDTLPQAVIVCDEHGDPVFRNIRAIALMGNRHGDALAAQAVDELLAATAPGASEERTLEL